MPCIILTHPDCLAHNPGVGHPETPKRLKASLQGIQDLPQNAFVHIVTTKAERTNLLCIHSETYVDQILNSAGTYFNIDYETKLSPYSVSSALWAAGAVLEGTRIVFDRTKIFNRALAIVRPPGHHAGKTQGQGYCIFNNVALAAYEALHLGAERVAIIDIDAHFGNGTQEIFNDNPRILMIDIHQRDLFPRGGNTEDKGQNRGYGFTINIPIDIGNDQEYITILDSIVAPAFRLFLPDIVIVALGFDAHKNDLLSNLCISTHGYESIMKRLSSFALQYAQNRLLAVLEGGYDLHSLPECIKHTILALSSDQLLTHELVNNDDPILNSLKIGIQREFQKNI
ncbi:MAG: histone deacetylase [Candidatus Magasanikbacteria bacterium]